MHTPCYSSLQHQAPVYIGQLHQAETINRTLIKQYQQVKESPIIKRTHHFMGRFENTYIPESLIPEIQKIIAMGKFYASLILNLRAEQLKMGFWFNEMHPGDQTTLHSHEEDDELLSAVYYIKAEKNSGDLMIQHSPHHQYYPPIAGNMILFKPQVLHQVEVNKSQTLRLSVAFNFGQIQ